MTDRKTDKDEAAVSRRSLLLGAGAAGLAAVSTPVAADEARPAGAGEASSGEDAAPDRGPLAFFTPDEARFVETAIDHLIPADDQWTGAVGAGVLAYIDGQLASAYGNGARMYLDGPWDAAAPPEQGYQLRHPPAELYRIAIEEARAAIREASGGTEFVDLPRDRQELALKALEAGSVTLPTVPSPVFFESLLANTVEGYFADPVYGGNRDMVSWRMLGFPGAYAEFVDLVDHHGVAYRRPPISLAAGDSRQHPMGVRQNG